MTAIDIATQVRAGHHTPREVVDACLARIADDRTGAFQLVDADGARRAADEVGARDDLRDLPLAGVPVAIKDCIAVAGHPTRHGSGATSADPVEADDELVVRLRRAGAIVVGKTRLPELAIWGFTESVAHGGTANPREPRRNAGGSTGGGAAAVAAGLVPLALGSDGGGSLRIPAANCGVVGFKPARGTMPLADGIAAHWYGCTEFGPITTTVADAVLAVDVLAGSSAWRGGGSPLSPQPTQDGLRVAVSLRSPSPLGPAGGAAREAVRRAAALTVAAGHELAQAHPPYPLTLPTIWGTRWLAGIAEDVDRLGLPVARLERRTQVMVRRGQRLRRRGKPDLAPADAWQAAATAFLSRYDVLITPTIARPAPRVGWATRTSYLRAYLNGAHTTPYTQAWNVAGFPALSLPLGGGSVQLICAPGNEPALLALATTLERAGT